MKEYEVTITYPVFVTCKVIAEDEDDALDKAWEKTALNTYVGNGGTDKLVGVSNFDSSIEPGETPIEDEPFQPVIRKLTRGK